MEFDVLISSGSILNVTVSGSPDAVEQFKQDVVRFYLKKNSPKRRHGNQKLTEDQVRDMRRLHDDLGWGRVRLARKFKVGKTTVERILKNESWKDV